MSLNSEDDGSMHLDTINKYKIRSYSLCSRKMKFYDLLCCSSMTKKICVCFQEFLS